ncbi:MAG: 3-deoxy-D-manno-octulosonic acid transferase [Bacteroidales bacterium]|nr:3-deoxy-D-manno-octulosonic acid transferase [Bacteroidales bacterium]
MFFYNIGIYCYDFVAKLLALKNPKAKQWVRGRKTLLEDMQQQVKPSDKRIWVHCPSLGEFEQGRPLIERIKKYYPEYQIFLTFFSPSGYEVRKNYPMADDVYYLPIDKPKYVKRFFDIVQPQYVFFVKYDYWLNYIQEAYRRKIPFYSISCIFRPQQFYFKVYGKPLLQKLKLITCFYCQDENSATLLQQNGIQQVKIVGDTRFDRVQDVVNAVQQNDIVQRFVGDKFTLVAGSSWLPDEILIAQLIEQYADIQLVIAPHEVDEERVEELQQLFGHQKTIRYTQVQGNQDLSLFNVLIIDTIGILNALYTYGQVVYIGGGFGRGIHNTLEAATYGKPIVFGPKYQKFKEAVDLVNQRAAFAIHNYAELQAVFERLLQDEDFRRQASQISKTYVATHVGATEKILQDINL